MSHQETRSGTSGLESVHDSTSSTVWIICVVKVTNFTSSVLMMSTPYKNMCLASLARPSDSMPAPF